MNERRRIDQEQKSLDDVESSRRHRARKLELFLDRLLSRGLGSLGLGSLGWDVSTNITDGILFQPNARRRKLDDGFLVEDYLVPILGQADTSTERILVSTT
jgi:hypothetical protein